MNNENAYIKLITLAHERYVRKCTELNAARYDAEKALEEYKKKVSKVINEDNNKKES